MNSSGWSKPWDITIQLIYVENPDGVWSKTPLSANFVGPSTPVIQFNELNESVRVSG